MFLGTITLPSGALGISSDWDALVHELKTGAQAPCNLIVSVESPPCECADDCSCSDPEADILCLYKGTGQDRKLVGMEAVFSTPELMDRAAAALHVSGVSFDNPNYLSALSAIHAALRAEIAQWAPEGGSVTHGSLEASNKVSLGDAYMWPELELELDGCLDAVWFLDEQGALARLQLLLV